LAILGNNNHQMDLKQACKWFVIGGTLVIWIIKFLVRPLQLFDDPGRYMLNIAPNLLGSFLIPFAAYWFFSGRDHLMARIFRIESNYDLRIVCLSGFCMLIINEYLQLIPFFGRTFDYNDILFSSIGLIISCFVFEKVKSRSQETSAQPRL
jgi:hypothetical protein